ncbi:MULTISPECIES: DUF1652 domain-containing protein [Pseudomonas]|uniref:DUF1652 domain-containing protein n=2 Tax=Pseudomonas TaxID=286 RepID=A0A0D0KYJ4_9PSED|nr:MULTISPECIES: DUF1652 domain-containing protein [Pseudomonas]KIQ03542.1 hypothetical protein RU08_06310 [Pseudomonas fulva]
MMSPLEFRQIVESAFLPMKCTCSVAPDDSVTIQIRDPATEAVLLNVAGLKRSELGSSRAISKIVLQIRQDLAALQMASPICRRQM